MSTWKVILATLVIFSAGLVAGVFVAGPLRGLPSQAEASPPPWVFQGPDFVQQRFLDRMKTELSLSPDQAQRLSVIFRDSRERMKSWWEVIGPEMRAELKDVREKIQTQLTPLQREQFEKLLKERRHAPVPPGDKRWRDRRGSPPRNPHGAPGEGPGPAPTNLPPAVPR